MAAAASHVHMPGVSLDAVYLDRLIQPRRALSPRGLAWVMAGLLVWSAIVSGFLFLIGAWPAPLFLGLDVVGLGLAFLISNRRARNGERVRVSGLAVTVERGAGAVVWTAPPAWTRVLPPGVDRRAAVRLTSSGRTVEVGRALGAADRRRFAQALEHAVEAARRG